MKIFFEKIKSGIDLLMSRKRFFHPACINNDLFAECKTNDQFGNYIEFYAYDGEGKKVVVGRECFGNDAKGKEKRNDAFKNLNDLKAFEYLDQYLLKRRETKSV